MDSGDVGGGHDALWWGCRVTVPGGELMSSVSYVHLSVCCAHRELCERTESPTAVTLVLRSIYESASAAVRKPTVT